MQHYACNKYQTFIIEEFQDDPECAHFETKTQLSICSLHEEKKYFLDARQIFLTLYIKFHTFEMKIKALWAGKLRHGADYKPDQGLRPS